MDDLNIQRPRPQTQPGLRLLSINIRGLESKIHNLAAMIAKYRPDIVTLQETNVHNNYSRQAIINKLKLQNTIFNYALHRHSGTVILQTSATWELKQGFTPKGGREIIAKIKNETFEYNLVAIHAPSEPHDRPKFFKELANKLYPLTDRHRTLIIGDFNITLEDRDIVGHSGKARIGRKELKDVVDDLDLQDAFRIIHPTRIDTTHRNTSWNRAARIDRLYVPSSTQIQAYSHLDETLTFTDHKGILVTIGTQNQPSRSPSWKLNDSLLATVQFKQAILDLIEFTKDAITPQSNIQTVMDTFRQSVKIIAQHFGRVRKTSIHKQITALESILLAAPKLRQTNREEYIRITKTLEELKGEIYEGAKIRTNLQTLNDKPTKKFIALETDKNNRNKISAIRTETGETTTDQTEITAAFRNYYKDLYGKEATDNDIQETYLQYVRKIRDDDRDFIDEDITMIDIRKALNEMNENSAPGPNGLTVKFYKTFFTELAPLLVKMIDRAINGEGLSKELKQSHITLLPKDSGDPLLTKNYRPISLLNIEYKLITKVLANKISPFLESVVNPDQAAAIKNRNIQNHTHLIRDIITIAHDRGDKTCILSMDQQKAFDMVSHEWLELVLSRGNFGRNFIQWIRLLYEGATSRVVVNGTLSEAFELGRGVRQGDPLSMLLYVLTLEPLLECIRQDKDITGIDDTSGNNIKLLAFADDTNFFPNTQIGIKKIITHFQNFSKCSGAKLNLDKSKGMTIGKGDKFRRIEGIKWVDKIKIFGVTFRNNRDPVDKETWGEILKETQGMIDRFSNFSTSIFGRANIINTLIQPKLLYLAHVDTPSRKTLKQYNKQVRAFLFKGTIRGIKHTTLIQEKIKGGVNLHDLETKIQSLRLKNLIKLINKQVNNPIQLYYISAHMKKHIKYTNTRPHFFGTLPPYYKHVVEIYKRHIDLITTNPKKIYNTLIATQQEPLDRQLKRLGVGNTTEDIFKDLHTNPNFSHCQRNILYRLLFSITPTSEGYAHRFGRQSYCIFCNRHQETEEHLYYTCTTLNKLKVNLIKLLRQPINTDRELYRLIFLGITTTNSGNDIRRYRQTLAQLYRDTIWEGRNEATHNRRVITENALSEHFLVKTKHYIQTKVSITTLETLSQSSSLIRT